MCSLWFSASPLSIWLTAPRSAPPADDYKPWRTVGSFVKWMFCIIPFVDYTPEAGPCAAVPGSYHKTTILPSDGRVHQVDAGQVPVRHRSPRFSFL